MRTARPQAWHGFALIDALPAGLEAVNPALATSITVPPRDDGDAADDGAACTAQDFLIDGGRR